MSLRLLALLCVAGPAHGACLAIHLTPDTVQIGDAPPLAEPPVARVASRLPTLESALRRLVTLPCATVSASDATPFGRIARALNTARQVWSPTLRIRLPQRAVALHFTAIKAAPPDLEEHSGCMRPRARLGSDRVGLYREWRGDVLYVERALGRELSAPFADGRRGPPPETLQQLFGGGSAEPLPALKVGARRPKPAAPVSQPAPAPVVRPAPAAPPGPTPDRVVPLNAKTAAAITAWAGPRIEGDESCVSAAVEARWTRRWSAVRPLVVGLAAAGYAPELLAMMDDL